MKALIPDSADLDWFGTKPAREAFPPPKGKRPPRPPQDRYSADEESDEEDDEDEEDEDEDYDEDEEDDEEDEEGDSDEEDEDSEEDLEAVRQFLQARKERRRGLAREGKGHIHTDKWHRCVEHVKKRGGGYEPHAVCTSSIGYKGSINPEHRRRGKARESDSLDLEMQQIFRESERGFDPGTTLFESNDCHNPAGPGGGQFCSHSSLRVGDRFKLNPSGTEEYTKTGGSKYKNAKGDEGFIPSNALVYPSATTFKGQTPGNVFPKKARSPHKVQYVRPGAGEHQDLVAKYRGMNINWYRPYQNQFYIDAPGFGQFHSKRSVTALRKDIDRMVDTGVTQQRHSRARASERYQRRKARYGRG